MRAKRLAKDVRGEILLNRRDVEDILNGNEVRSFDHPDLVIYADYDDTAPNPFYCCVCGEPFGNGIESISYDGEWFRHMTCAKDVLNNR